MNNKLKKDTGKKPQYQKMYMNGHKMLCICLDKYDDRDIISWLSRQSNKSEAVRKILREAIG